MREHAVYMRTSLTPATAKALEELVSFFGLSRADCAKFFIIEAVDDYSKRRRLRVAPQDVRLKEKNPGERLVPIKVRAWSALCERVDTRARDAGASRSAELRKILTNAVNVRIRQRDSCLKETLPALGLTCPKAPWET